MKEINIITTNKNKFKTFERRLEDLGFKVSYIPIEIPESKDLDIETVCRKKLEFAKKLQRRKTF